jgi:hypothetical protein
MPHLLLSFQIENLNENNFTESIRVLQISIKISSKILPLLVIELSLECIVNTPSVWVY